ncbi:MAG: dehydrogenase [Pirellulaceae bacterium]|nr:MAG: dehydrogenase [Pirellulaceae bacterium]
MFLRIIRAIIGTVTALIVVSARADDWPQWLGPNRDGVWRESGICRELPQKGPPIRWRTSIGGGYAGPAVAEGRVFVTDRLLVPGQQDPDNPFQRGRTASIERVLCLRESDGKVLWKHEYSCAYTISYPAGPRATPAVSDGKVYTLGAEGHFFCLAIDDGHVVWSRDLKQDYRIRETPVWGFASHSLVDGDAVICLVGAEDALVVAWDKQTGRELWRALSAQGPHGPGYSAPILVTAGGRRQLIVWHPAGISSLDPATGELFWQQPFSVREGLSLATPRVAGNRLFVSAFYDGSLMLQLADDRPMASRLWQRRGANERNTDALHCLISTPFLDGDYIYGVCSYGQLRCLDARDGRRLWESLEATGATGSGTDRWANAFLVKHEDRYFLFNEKGELIIAKLSPEGYREISRSQLLEPTGTAMRRKVVWSHPAFANRSIYARNDKEIVCASLAAP